jgi:hypothetical protein
VHLLSGLLVCLESGSQISSLKQHPDHSLAKLGQGVFTKLHSQIPPSLFTHRSVLLLSLELQNKTPGHSNAQT